MTTRGRSERFLRWDVDRASALGRDLLEKAVRKQGLSLPKLEKSGELTTLARGLRAADGEELIIRQALPQDVWYQVNGHGIRHYHGVQIQVRDWEEVQEELHAA